MFGSIADVGSRIEKSLVKFHSFRRFGRAAALNSWSDAFDASCAPLPMPTMSAQSAGCDLKGALFHF
jgi:hypothetical protein